MSYEEWIKIYGTKVFYPHEEMPSELPENYCIKPIYNREVLNYFLVYRCIKDCGCHNK